MMNAGIVKIAPATSASPDRGRRARDVLLEHAASQRGDSEKRQRDHCRGDGRGHRLAGLHPEVCVGGAENEGEKKTETDGLHRQSRDFLSVGRIKPTLPAHNSKRD